MPFDFPTSPTTGETLEGPFGEIYTWDGEKWTLTVGGSAGGGGGGSVDPADLISADPGNILVEGTDDLLYVPPPGPPTSMPMGVTDGSNAAPGQVGEVITGVPTNNQVGAPLNVLTLPAGDWDLGGYINFVGQTFGGVNAGAIIVIVSLSGT